jgi:hypothetical protein
MPMHQYAVEAVMHLAEQRMEVEVLMHPLE